MVIPDDVFCELQRFRCPGDPEGKIQGVLEAFAATKGRHFLEIGTYEGATSAAVTRAFPSARVVTLDLPEPRRTPWSPLSRERVGEAHRALGVTQRISQLFMDSSELWRLAARGASFDLVLVDGDLSFAAALRDLLLAADLVQHSGGVLLVNDPRDAGQAIGSNWAAGLDQAVRQFLTLRPFRARRVPGPLLALEQVPAAGLPARPDHAPLASVSFREPMGYSLARLMESVSTHNNLRRLIRTVPAALRGRWFTQLVANHAAPVDIELRSSGRVYVLAAHGWEGYERAARFLDATGRREPTGTLHTHDGTIFEVWSLAGDAGARFRAPTQVMLVADDLTRLG